MTTGKKRRFPSDRVKLHALLDKRKQELSALQEEVNDLEAAVIEADHTAIHATTDAYAITPDQLKDLFEAMRKGLPMPPELLAKIAPVDNADKQDFDLQNKMKESDTYSELPEDDE